jgi:D-proline reductase (dithiol) PrdB
MDLMKKLRAWRIIGKTLNIQGVDRIVDPFRGVMNRILAAPTHNFEGDIPWTPLGKDLSKCRASSIITAGFHTKDQEPFDVDSAVGDPSFRRISFDVDKSDLRIAHTHYPHQRVNQDINVLLPLDRMRELTQMGVLAGLAPYFYSFGFAGMLTKAFIKEPGGTAHKAAKLLKEDGADFVVFVPG